jgi:glycosidase
VQFADDVLRQSVPASIRNDVALPRREAYHPSPNDWRDEILYFLLVDRFSDGRETPAGLLDRARLADARPDGWRWEGWAESADRFQGGTLQGVRSKLAYLKQLGVTTLWLSPIFKQRGHLDTFHGYAIQDFLDVDPHFGRLEDLVELVAAAHGEGMRIILDVIFNHSGPNWLYPQSPHFDELKPPYRRDQYGFGNWRGDDGRRVEHIDGREDAVWPRELQDPERYTRAGRGSLAHLDLDDLNDPFAEHKRSDFEDLRDFNLGTAGLLTDLALCFKYWIALADCDGFRIDTVKHVSFEEARNFCGTIREFAANLGKVNFLLAAEVAGGDFAQDRYLDVLGRNVSAALDIGEMRPTLSGVAKGLVAPGEYFKGFDPGDAQMGSHRDLGNRHVSILDDHDHVFGEKIRFSSEASSDHQVVAGVALQLLTLGIPCIYYGTEQAFAGPEPGERQWLPQWKGHDRYLREAMLGRSHPHRSGRAGLQDPGEDTGLPGFGPFGTSGSHCFDQRSPAFVRITALAALRQAFPVLRHGRQYQRQITNFGGDFRFPGSGELIAWSRILDDEEALCVINGHGTDGRGGDVVVGAELNPSGTQFTVLLNTAETKAGEGFAGSHLPGSTVSVRRRDDGTAYVEIRDLPPSEVLVLTNRP